MASEGECDACAALILGSALQVDEEECEGTRRVWTHDWLLRRPSHGSYFSLQREFRSEEQLFEKYLKLPVFDFILKRITPIVEKQETHLRQTISPGARLEATLLFLITGDYYSRLQHLTRIHQSTLGRFIPEICEAIYSELGNEYIKTPTTAGEYGAI